MSRNSLAIAKKYPSLTCTPIGRYLGTYLQSWLAVTDLCIFVDGRNYHEVYRALEVLGNSTIKLINYVVILR